MDNENLINRYFEGTLTPQERMLFDDLLKSDSDFSEQLRFHKMTKAAITLESRKELKNKLQKFEQENSPAKKSKNWLYIAASVVILLGISLFFVNQDPSSNKLYAQYFEPYPNTVAPIVRSNSQRDIKNDAFAAYENENYQKATELFSQLSSETNEEFAIFYNAMSLMKLERISEASELLAETNWSKSYNDKALWYLSLCRLKENNIPDTKRLLQKLITANGFKNKEAKSLMSKLK